ncbi:hypothetical protein PBI_EGAD_57 [Arthrobacter phage Egad]|nr:hypothetical protein PBI_EGAD_57 [Arthrobacter phage Egad]
MHEGSSGTKRCAHESCGRTFEFTNWGHHFINDDGWFHQHYSAHWCPDHIPDWIGKWVDVIKPYRPSQGIPNVDKRPQLEGL